MPHPLSAAGFEAYDFRIVDSLTIRTPDRTLDVLQVNVRPKDDTQAAAVGAVFIERGTAAVVRMTLSFTRAALKDRQLEDVSIILENGLVDGRFWLPRRQEIEIRRSATWMDFPARGIIRGRWEVCCVETNRGLAPRTFVGPEIAEVPRAQQRAYPFEGELLRTLPEEVRALDAAEVRRVQEEARALVRAGALARARNTAPAARAVSDLVRVDRAEGLALGAGMTQSLGGGFRTTIAGRYGFGDSRWKGRGTLTWEAAAGHQVTFEGRDDFADAGDVAEVSGLRNSLAAQEFGSDWTDPYGVRGGALRIVRGAVGRQRWSAEVAREAQRALPLRGVPTSGRYEPLLPADAATVDRLAVRWSLAPSAQVAARGIAGWAQAGLIRARPDAGGRTTDALRVAAEVESFAAGGGGRFALRTFAAAVGGGAVPVQALPVLGGPVTAPGTAFHALRGRVAIAQRLEWQRRVPFLPLELGRFGRVPSSLVVAPYAHAALVRGTDGAWRSRPAVGLGVLGLFDLFRLDVARPVRGGGWLLSVDVAREFWKVL